MVTYNTQIEIPRSVKEVYAVISDYKKAPQWITGLKQIDILSGTPGREGAKSKYTFEERGKEVIFYEKMVEVQPESYFIYRLQSDAVNMEAKTALEPRNGHTVVKMNNKVQGNSFLMKLVLPFMKGMMKKRQLQDLQQLKALLES